MGRWWLKVPLHMALLTVGTWYNCREWNILISQCVYFVITKNYLDNVRHSNFNQIFFFMCNLLCSFFFFLFIIIISSIFIIVVFFVITPVSHLFICSLFQEVQLALTGVPRARCQAARTTRHTVTPSPISVTPCHRSMPRSHATATRLRGSTGSCGTGPRGRRKRRRSAYWNAWRERKKAARPATEGGQAALGTCVPPTPSAEKCKQTLTRSAPTTKPGPCRFFCHLCFVHHTKHLRCSCSSQCFNIDTHIVFKCFALISVESSFFLHTVCYYGALRQVQYTYTVYLYIYIYFKKLCFNNRF